MRMLLTAVLLFGCAQTHAELEEVDGGGPDGGVVDAGSTSPGDDAGAIECRDDETRCVGACVDTSDNPDHCGSCGISCVGSEVCSLGECARECADGLVDCDGSCVDLRSDLEHCGACSAACATAAGAVSSCEEAVCRLECEEGRTDCDEDLATPAGNGCETDLGSDVARCGTCGVECAAPNGTPGCADGDCVLETCDLGFDDCDGELENGCEVDVRADPANCGACGRTCAVETELCHASSCGPTGESCDAPLELVEGTNSIPWRATRNDHMPTYSRCYEEVFGPDIVARFTPTFDGFVRVRVTGSPIMSVTIGTCPGPYAQCNEGAAGVDTQLAFAVSAHNAYFIHLAGRSTEPLSNPVEIALSRIDCTTDVAQVLSLDPGRGATSENMSPVLTARFDRPVQSWGGVVTITGDMGTSHSLPVSSREVSITSSPPTLFVDRMTYQPGENVTVTWSGIRDAWCRNETPDPGWSFRVVTPSCVPGAGGVYAGRTVARVPTSLPFAPVFIGADGAADGWIYASDTSSAPFADKHLYRIRKGTGAVEDVEAAALMGNDQIGAGVIVDGNEIYSLGPGWRGTGTWVRSVINRISTDGGSTWTRTDYGRIPLSASGTFRGGALWQRAIYVVSSSWTGPTEIWRVPTHVPFAAGGVLEATVPGEVDCGSIAVDASFFYLTCDAGRRLVRIRRATGTAELVATPAYWAHRFRNAITADDFDGDGLAEVLYVKSDETWLDYVCDPGGLSPFRDAVPSAAGIEPQLLTVDRAAPGLWGLLWTYAGMELVRIE